MTFGRRRSLARRLTVLGAAVVVQIWSLAPMAASVVYCIGEDGHSGFELVKAGARGCAACCHEPEEGAVRIGGSPVSECTDIKLSPAAGIASKLSPSKVDGSFVATALPATVIAVVPGGVPKRHREIFVPPRGSPAQMLRHTVLLI